MNPHDLHKESIVFDAHCDTLLEVLDGKRRLAERAEKGHVDLPRLKEGGVTAQIFAIFARQQYLPSGAAKEALRILDTFYRELKANEESLLLAISAADIERAKREGKVAAILSLEGAEALEGDLGVLRMFHRLGVRNLGITWNFRNQAADGLDEARSKGGLTNFGLELVRELNRLGIMIDVSHLAPAGVNDVLASSEAPVIASHSNAYALCPHRRNLADEQIQDIAEKGGVIGVTFVPQFLDPDEKRASLERVLDHIDYIVQVAGVDHVGLGSDFDGFFEFVKVPGIEDVSQMPNITFGLLERGYNVEEVKKIMGGNFLRVFRQVVG
ncbi:MAG: dipeptidase [Anaerolineae bacterium]